MAQRAQADAEAGAGGRAVTLDGHFEIFLDRPVPELRAPHAAAYGAIDGALTGQPPRKE